MIDIGLLIIRLVVGLTFMGHGAQKMFGWFNGPGLIGTASWLKSIGVKPARANAFLAALAELVGGFLFAAGILNWLGTSMIIFTMFVAIFKVHGKNGYWATEGGFEYNFILIAVAFGIALIGPGTYVLF